MFTTSLRSVVVVAGLLASATPIVKRGAPAGVPQYVIDYAPVVRLYSADPYRPSDIGATLINTVPQLNLTPVANIPDPLTLNNLDALNSQDGANIWLTSKEDVTTNPAWLYGVPPDAQGCLGNATATAVIVVDKGNGIVDAFYQYFYAFDYGGIVLNFNAGNHVGDWEHNMIRFNNSKPEQIWFSAHSDGDAYYWDVVQKEGLRPVVFSANGSHANYANAAKQDRELEGVDIPDLLADYTDEGPRWDPTHNSYYFKYDVATSTFSTYDDCTPLAWINFIGRWGDQQYPNSDPRQQNLLNLNLAYKYVGGPTGPRDKQLDRRNVCRDDTKPCFIRTSLEDDKAGNEIP